MTATALAMGTQPWRVGPAPRGGGPRRAGGEPAARPRRRPPASPPAPPRAGSRSAARRSFAPGRTPWDAHPILIREPGLLGVVLGPPAPAPHDVLDVDLVRLVVEAERVHDQVDAHAEGQLALAHAAGDALVLPVAEVVARPGAAQVVLHVGHLQPAVAQHPLHDRAGGH